MTSFNIKQFNSIPVTQIPHWDDTDHAVTYQALHCQPDLAPQ